MKIILLLILIVGTFLAGAFIANVIKDEFYIVSIVVSLIILIFGMLAGWAAVTG